MISRIYVTATVALIGLIVPGVTAASAQRSQDSAPRYQYVTVALPGEKNTAVADINDFGSYVGEGCNASCTKRRQFIASPQGKLTFLPAIPFANFSPSASYVPVGIDDRGDVDGQYTDPQGATHGYLLSADGAWTKIDDPLAADINGGGTVPESISADGSVIPGTYYDSNLMQHGFLYHDGTFTTYDVPGASGTVINFYQNGEFGGAYTSSNGASYPFYVTNNGQLYTPGPPNPTNDASAYFTAVSADGTLFGFEQSQSPMFGFAYANGKYTTITDPHEVATTSLDGTEAVNANLEGVVVGDYTYTPGTGTQAGYLHGYIAIPRPEGAGGSQ
jgi:probable HAF family extracellular repeat protein